MSGSRVARFAGRRVEEAEEAARDILFPGRVLAAGRP